MKALVVYDSAHGNTESIARAIGRAIEGEVPVLHVGQTRPADIAAIDLLLLGSPTLGGRPTEAMQAFLKKLPEPAGGSRAAAFDTRLAARWVRIFGYAADRIATALKQHGWNVAAADGFIVDGREGPLRQGETERATEWARQAASGKR